MPRRALRFLIILGIVYASLFGGVVEHDPLMSIIAQVALSLVLIVWLLILWRERRPFPATPFDAPLLALGLVWTASALFSRDPRVSLGSSWAIWMHILFFYVLVDLMRRGQRGQQWVIEGLFITGGLIILLTVVETAAWYFGLSILPQFVQGWPPLFGFSLPPVIHQAALALNYNNPEGAYCLLVIPLALAGASTLQQRDLRWGARGIAGGLTVVLLLTQSRGAYVGFAVLAGATVLMWLLRPDVRQRFPAALRPWLDPRLLLAGAALAACALMGLVFWTTVGGRTPQPNDVARLDLWTAAIQMFLDHPLLGVGPRQFGSVRLGYLHWDWSYSYLPLQHAHNLYLNWLAEGGILGLAAGFWLLIRFGRVWWAAWRGGELVRRRRLEGVLVALLAFAAHNLVDTFVHTQLMTPVLIMGAYVVAGDMEHVPVAAQRAPGRRKLVFVALGALLVVQAAFIPLHRAAWDQQRMLARLGTNQLSEALSAVQEARAADPWFGLYRLEEAYILGRLAADDPGTYLAQAMAAYEESLKHNPSWAEGWHNLGALYAQAGHYEDAATAAQTAIRWDPIQAGYYFKLGQYFTALGRDAEARDAYYEALRRAPWLASSGFWTDPAHPERAQILSGAIADNADQPERALDIAVSAGDLEAAVRISDSVDSSTASAAMRTRLDALWPDHTTQPCTRCYVFVFWIEDVEARQYLVRAEQMLDDATVRAPDGLTPDKAARAALFLSEGRAAWGWYILAQLAERDNAGAEQINRMLARAVLYPSDYRDLFDSTVYGMDGEVGILPQAQTPIMSWQVYEPWLQLAARHEAAGEWEDARTIYERILQDDPYAWQLRERLDALAGKQAAGSSVALRDR
jgi:O-antigen ligase/tetratricopeptide (TPR) repeat protein